jgi:hypothetical protein
MSNSTISTYQKGIDKGLVPVKLCSAVNDFGGCFCPDGCEYFTWFWGRNGEPVFPLRIAPNPDGTCSCGLSREQCPNFQADGSDCHGFEGVDHYTK